MLKNVSLLLGAGVSIPAGLPSTGEITKELFEGKSDSLKTIIKKDDELVLRFLKLIYRKIDEFYENKTINYEDLYYITTQIKDYLVEYENPIVANFTEDIIAELSQFYYLKNSSKNANLENKLSKVASMAGNYINDVTTQLLRNDMIKTNHLSFIEGIVADKSVENLTIFTLNHDIIIERYLKDNKIDYYDGFIYDKLKSKNGDIRLWQADFINATQKIRLLKLHGSIDWYKIKTEDFNFYQKYSFAQIGNLSKLKDFSGDKRPLILTGRFNKILEYNRSIYVDLHYNFYRILPTTNILLISGYSFNDKGINSWLIDWMYAVEEHKIVLIHPRPDKCIMNARFGIKHHWRIWQKENKVKIISIFIEEFTWKKYSKIISS